MTKVEKIIVQIYGHSNDALGLLTLPTMIMTIMIASLAIFMPGLDSLFLFGVLCAFGVFQAVGARWALKIRLKYGA